MKPKILICEDDLLVHAALTTTLKKLYQLTFTKNSTEAIYQLEKGTFDVLLLDVGLRTPDEGFEFLPQVKAKYPDLPVLITSGLTSFDAVVKALRLGATDYVPKNSDPKELLAQVARAITIGGARKNLPKDRVNTMIGSSPQMEEIREKIKKIRTSPWNVLIAGEPGSGKELVAREIAKGAEPFVAIDCSTIPASMAEGFLFGHEKGAFTGADRANRGVFEEANGGALFLDEITNMPFDLQAKFLRVLQEKEIRRLGSNQTLPVQFRLICATNQKIEELCDKGLFRYDLYSRISVLNLEIPPLRKRTEDIPELLMYFAKQSQRDLKFSSQVLQVLQSYSWPGNVRELSNLVLNLSVMCENDQIEVSDLPSKYSFTFGTV